MNALDLLETAEELFRLNRFAHSTAFSTLAIEESGKLSLLLAVFMALWRAWRALELLPNIFPPRQNLTSPHVTDRGREP